VENVAEAIRVNAGIMISLMVGAAALLLFRTCIGIARDQPGRASARQFCRVSNAVLHKMTAAAAAMAFVCLILNVPFSFFVIYS
jgi:hypothetical protein